MPQITLAAAQQGVSKIVYISGSRFDIETVQRLENYGVPVEKTNTQIKRPHINAELQMSKYDDIRTAMRMILPRKWTLSYLVDYFMKWLNDTWYIHAHIKIMIDTLFMHEKV